MLALVALLERFCAVFGTCSMGVTDRIPVTAEFLAEKITYFPAPAHAHRGSCRHPQYG